MRDCTRVYMHPVIQQVHTSHPRPRRLAPTLQPNQDRWFDSSSPRLRYPALECSTAESVECCRALGGSGSPVGSQRAAQTPRFRARPTVEPTASKNTCQRLISIVQSPKRRRQGSADLPLNAGSRARQELLRHLPLTVDHTASVGGCTEDDLP